MRVRSPGVTTAAREVDFVFDGRVMHGLEGESIAAALTVGGVLELRRARRGDARGLFCGMGVCFECVVTIDGRVGQRACMTKLAAGMRIEPQSTPAAAPAGAMPIGAEPTAEPETIESPDVLIVGGGPAGLNAARAAALAGAAVVVVDARSSPGGQYFKQLARTHDAAGGGLDDQMRAGSRLVAEVAALGVRVMSDAQVWGAFKPREIAVLAGARAVVFRPRALVLATGAYERGVPVPGWTLPGFMTTGAAQTLLRSHQVAPGARVLIAGNGPLNLQLAVELGDTGVEVVAVAEVAARPGISCLSSILAATWQAPDLMRQGWRYLRRLASRGVPVLHRHVIVVAEGEDRVRAAQVAPLDAAGAPRRDAARRFVVDAVCAGYGFEPVNEIARALGCRHVVDEARGTLATVVDADRRSSADGVFVAGDSAGMGGAHAAQEQGFIAGLAAARHAGRATTPALELELARRRRRLVAHDRFQAALWRIFAAPRLGDLLAASDTTICRCEEVPRAALAEAVAAGLTMAGAVKRLTRAGMGSCQGRYCAPLVARACAAASGEAIDEFSGFAPRPPLMPTLISALARERPDPVASEGRPGETKQR